MKKETKPNQVSVYELTVTKKALDEIVADILLSYQQNKKIKVTVSV